MVQKELLDFMCILLGLLLLLCFETSEKYFILNTKLAHFFILFTNVTDMQNRHSSFVSG